MSENNVVVSERTTPYRGYMRLDHYKLRHTIFNGEWSVDLSREVLERGHAVSVLPYDPIRDEVVLIEQFRIGAYTAPKTSPWQIECVAGMIEPHQLAEDTAHRETHRESAPHGPAAARNGLRCKSATGCPPSYTGGCATTACHRARCG